MKTPSPSDRLAVEPGAAAPTDINDFEAMLTTRDPLDRVDDAIQAMRAFREIEPLVLPWGQASASRRVTA